MKTKKYFFSLVLAVFPLLFLEYCGPTTPSGYSDFWIVNYTGKSVQIRAYRAGIVLEMDGLSQNIKPSDSAFIGIMGNTAPRVSPYFWSYPVDSVVLVFNGGARLTYYACMLLYKQGKIEMASKCITCAYKNPFSIDCFTPVKLTDRHSIFRYTITEADYQQALRQSVPH